MAAGSLQGSMPVLISVHQQGAPTQSWPEVEEQSSNAVEESIPFTRPAITTGAHLPWKVNKRSSYSVPRAICSLQTVPPITLLNNRKEATKLVYSKDTENAAPAESPFKSISHVGIFEEECVEGNLEPSEKRAAPVMTVGIDSLEPLDGDRLGSNQASSGAVPKQMFNNSTRVVGHLPNQVVQPQHKYRPPRMPQRISTAYSPAQVKVETGAPRWLGTAVDLPVTDDGNVLQANAEPEHLNGAAAAIGSSYAAESAEAINARASSLYKSSGDSSLLRLPEAVMTIDDMDTMDGSSRSQSLADKRKADSIEAIFTSPDNEGQICERPEDLKENLNEQRAVRRRITNRASAIRTAEKKNLEQTRLEKTYEKLATENSELAAKLKRQTKTCSELKVNLEATQEKLRVQEDMNSKLKSEMDFLRHNLALLPQPQASIEVGAGTDAGDSPTSGHLDWTPEFPYPTQMPTQAEIAADLELDRQILTHSDCGHEYLKEWQMW